jgi:hypothetical protein
LAALDWFESIEQLQKSINELRDQVESAYAAAGPHGQQMGSIGGGGGRRDALAGVDSVIDSGAAARLDQAQAELIELLDQATDVLYGRSGSGGVAKAIGHDEADILCFHYLQGEAWSSIAKRYDPDTTNLTMWCKYRAHWTCRQIDRLGMDALADS